MISRKTLLRNVAGVFVSAKELNERGFKFFKLLVSTEQTNIYISTFLNAVTS